MNKKVLYKSLLIFASIMVMSCSKKNKELDFTELNSPRLMEEAFSYNTMYLPEKDKVGQSYIGDTMPYYEDGTYYIYYLRDEGVSFNHSIYLLTTKDFVTYSEFPSVIIEAGDGLACDSWIGTGSVVKVKDTYYFFYTGHVSSELFEYKERILVAKGTSPYSFEKIEGWEILPPDELNQKRDFRDPQAYYDEENNCIRLTVTASKNGVPSVLEYNVSGDLTTVDYNGVIFSDNRHGFWNLECTDTFCINSTWYLTYSAQDDTLWYASSQSPHGPFSEPKRLEGKLFYAAKHVSDGKNNYVAGWARRGQSLVDTQKINGWAGNLVVQKLYEKEKGELALCPVEEVLNVFSKNVKTLLNADALLVKGNNSTEYNEAFYCYESFKITGDVIFESEGKFGLSFDYDGTQKKCKQIIICPEDDKIKLAFNEGKYLITAVNKELQPQTLYHFTYIQDGSVGLFCLDDITLTVRLYGVSGKNISLFANNNSVQFSNLKQFVKR